MSNLLAVRVFVGASALAFIAGSAIANPHIVDGKMNIWGAGQAAPPGFNPGILPLELPLGFTAVGGEVIQFPSITGLTNCCNSTPNTTPDGEGNPYNTLLTPTNGMSGIQGYIGMSLVGVFHTDAGPGGTPPPTLNYDLIGKNFQSFEPVLNQVFFIGNGRDNKGDLQSFKIPAGATKLYLGIPDGNSFNGPPGWYNDNTGFYTLEIDIAGSCYPDCDGDTFLSIDDFICFQTLFALGDPAADCDGDTALTIDDFICFQTYFAIGC